MNARMQPQKVQFDSARVHYPHLVESHQKTLSNLQNMKIANYTQQQPTLRHNFSATSQSMLQSGGEHSRVLQHDTSLYSQDTTPQPQVRKTALGAHHKTVTSNQFKYRSHLKRHTLQRILIEKDGTSSISKFMKQAEMQKIIDYDLAG